jgi:hypothetical protein
MLLLTHKVTGILLRAARFLMSKSVKEQQETAKKRLSVERNTWREPANLGTLGPDRGPDSHAPCGNGI